MAGKNISFYEYNDGSYYTVDLYIYDRFFEYEDSYNYYDIDIDKILLYKKSNNEYIIRYNDVNKMNVLPLQLKIKNCNDIINEIKYNNKLILIRSNDKELFRKIREIWNKIIELIGVNNANDYVRNTEYGDEHITTNVYENTSFIENNYRDELAIVLHSVVGMCLERSLVQVRTHKCV